MQISKRIQTYVDLAIRQAQQADSNLPHRHGCVLIKAGRVINVSHNKLGFSSFGRRFHSEADKVPSKASMHAELRAILNLDRTLTEGASLLVVRINRKGELRMSKPCSMCKCSTAFVGIKKIYYSTNEGDIEVMKL